MRTIRLPTAMILSGRGQLPRNNTHLSIITSSTLPETENLTSSHNAPVISIYTPAHSFSLTRCLVRPTPVGLAATNFRMETKPNPGKTTRSSPTTVLENVDLQRTGPQKTVFVIILVASFSVTICNSDARADVDHLFVFYFGNR